MVMGFFFSSRRRHTRYIGDWSSDVCSSDLEKAAPDHDTAHARMARTADRRTTVPLEKSVPGKNLTRDEAVARAAVVSVDRYDVALDLTTSDTTFRTTTTVTFSSAQPGASTF